jgi:hypothetical protein
MSTPCTICKPTGIEETIVKEAVEKPDIYPYF